MKKENHKWNLAGYSSGDVEGRKLGSVALFCSNCGAVKWTILRDNYDLPVNKNTLCPPPVQGGTKE